MDRWAAASEEDPLIWHPKGSAPPSFSGTTQQGFLLSSLKEEQTPGVSLRDNQATGAPGLKANRVLDAVVPSLAQVTSFSLPNIPRWSHPRLHFTGAGRMEGSVP